MHFTLDPANWSALTPMKRQLLLLLLILSATHSLSGCALGVGAGAATGAAVVYDRRTTGTMVDDELIEFKVIDAIRRDQELWNQIHLNATSYNNVVLLTGESPTEELRGRTDSLVRDIPKVRKVHNEMVIAAPSSLLSRSSDTWITGKVKTNMLTNSTELARIKVITENGSVYLMGLVTRAEADTATEIARKVSGVQRVVKVFEYIE